MKRTLTAPVRFGAWLAQKLSDPKQEKLRERLERAQENVGSKREAVHARVEASPRRSRKRTTAEEVAIESGGFAADGCVGPLFRGVWNQAEGALDLVGEIIGGVLGGLLDGL